MTIPLEDIAVVQMGLSFRSRIEPERGGNVAVIQMRDLTANHRLANFRNLIAIAMKDTNERHFVRRKDLVFRSRGKTTTAAIIDTEVDRTIIAAPLLRIRVTSKNVLPEYLCWFINQSSSQGFLHSRATGTAMVMIGKNILDALEVFLPSLARQRKIIALAALSDKEQTLMSDLAKKRKRMIEKILMRLATKSETNFNLNQ